MSNIIFLCGEPGSGKTTIGKYLVKHYLKDFYFLDKDTFSTVIENAPLISIDLVVKNSEDKILLGQRVNKPAKNSWFVPGGRIYKDEKIEDAFQRITKDEIGKIYKIDNAKFKGVYQHFYNDNVLHSICKRYKR